MSSSILDQSSGIDYGALSSPSVSPSVWTEEEDEQLLQLIKEHGSKQWTLIAHQLGGHKTTRQCRIRWKQIRTPSASTSTSTSASSSVSVSPSSSFSLSTSYFSYDQHTDNALETDWRDDEDETQIHLQQMTQQTSGLLSSSSSSSSTHSCASCSPLSYAAVLFLLSADPSPYDLTRADLQLWPNWILTCTVFTLLLISAVFLLHSQTPTDSRQIMDTISDSVMLSSETHSYSSARDRSSYESASSSPYHSVLVSSSLCLLSPSLPLSTMLLWSAVCLIVFACLYVIMVVSYMLYADHCKRLSQQRHFDLPTLQLRMQNSHAGHAYSLILLLYTILRCTMLFLLSVSIVVTYWRAPPYNTCLQPARSVLLGVNSLIVAILLIGLACRLLLHTAHERYASTTILER